MFYCLPNSAWADGNFAEGAWAATWWNIQIQINPTQVREQMNHPFSTAKKKLHQVKVSRRSLGTISTVAMLDSFVLKTISGLDVKILLSYIKYVSKFAIVYIY